MSDNEEKNVGALRSQPPLTLDDVLRRVDAIRKMVGDDESAHSEEDDLHRDVLQAIADGRCDEPRACAAAALKTCELDFARWYA